MISSSSRPGQEVDEMNDDLDRLEALFKDIDQLRLWDCIERLGQEILVLATAPRKGL